MRTFLTWVLLIVLIVAGAYFGSPWWTVWNLDRAARAGDAHAVANVVDFPAVRASLSPSLSAELQQALDREKTKPHSFLDKLLMFGRNLVQPKASDQELTPEGVTFMLKTAHPPAWSNPLKGEKAPPPGRPSLDLARTGYAADDLDQFNAVVDNTLAPGRAISLKLLRRGFLTWKVVGLDLIAVPIPAADRTAANDTTGP